MGDGAHEDDSSRIDTSRTEECGVDFLDHDLFGGADAEYLFRANDHFKLKRYEEKYSYSKDLKERFFSTLGRKELLTLPVRYC